MAGIKITLVEDVSSVVKGSADVARSFDKVADSLDDVARDAQKAGDDIAKGLDGGTDDATDSVDKLERTFRDMAKAASRSSKEAGDDVGDNVKKGYRDAERAARDFGDTADRETGRAGEATQEFKDEARANLSEVASSFSGDMSSAADLVQGTLGGLAGSLAGPAGLAAAALAVVGGGLLTSVNDAAEKAEQRVTDMFNDFLDSGAEYLSKEFIADEIAKIYEGADDAAAKVGAIREMAEATGIGEPLLARALVGDAAAREQVTAEIASKRLAFATLMDEANAKGLPVTQYADALLQLNGVEDAMEGTARNADKARANAEAAAEAIKGIDAGNAARSAAEAQAQFDGLGRKIKDLPETKSVRIDFDATELERYLARQRTLTVGFVARPGVPQAV